MREQPKPEGDETPEIRYVHKPPSLWPLPKFVWVIAMILLGILCLLAFRFWIALR